jgi:hypothetical protein
MRHPTYFKAVMDLVSAHPEFTKHTLAVTTLASTLSSVGFYSQTGMGGGSVSGGEISVGVDGVGGVGSVWTVERGNEPQPPEAAPAPHPRSMFFAGFFAALGSVLVGIAVAVGLARRGKIQLPVLPWSVGGRERALSASSLVGPPQMMMATSPAFTQPQTLSSFSVHSNVEHHKRGKGVVLSCTDTEIEVHFFGDNQRHTKGVKENVIAYNEAALQSGKLQPSGDAPKTGRIKKWQSSAVL